MATILEKLQKKYPNAKGINKANNIAEAVACIHGLSGREGNTIADNIWPMYSVAYMVNSGTGNTQSKDFAEITPVDLSAPTNDWGWTPPLGKGFVGWGETDDAVLPLTGPYHITEDTNLYAIWADLVTVSFNANGGSGEMDSFDVPENVVFPIPECGFTPPEGKAFTGWGTASDGEVAFQPGESEGTNESITLYAIWADAE